MPKRYTRLTPMPGIISLFCAILTSIGLTSVKIVRIDSNIGIKCAKKVYKSTIAWYQKPFFCAILTNVGLTSVKIARILTNIGINYAKRVYKTNTNAWYYKPFLCNSYQCWFKLSKDCKD
jgi:hypothetical protein